MKVINADTLRHWIEGECKSPSIPRNEAAFGKRILMHMEVMGFEDVQPGRWIPCDDKKPRVMTDVLLQFERNMCVGFYSHGDWNVNNGNDYYVGLTKSEDQPIAWMPLPAPYQEGANE